MTGVDRGEAAPVEAQLVGFHRRAVQFDRAQDRRLADRQQAALVGEADHEEIGGDGIAHERRRKLGGVKADDLIDRLEAGAFEEVRARHAELDESAQRAIAHQIAVAALRISALPEHPVAVKTF